MSTVLDFDIAPYRLSGTVYGTLLNHQAALDALDEAVNEAPYKAAPKAPVLYVKPRNTLNVNHKTIELPASTDALQVGSSLGLVIGKVASAVKEQDALDYLSGYTVVVDYSIPHDSFYRPSVRFKALDGSCVMGPDVVAVKQIANPDDLAVRVYLDDRLVHTTSTAGMIRKAARLLADVTDFMTLQPGDVLMLGVAADAPLARSGQRVKVEIEGIGALENTLSKEQV